jgi:hypothetical protein
MFSCDALFGINLPIIKKKRKKKKGKEKKIAALRYRKGKMTLSHKI